VGNVRWKALSVLSGTWTGFLRTADDTDWYAFPIQAEQGIDIYLSMPQGASFSMALYPPHSGNSVGNVTSVENERSFTVFPTMLVVGICG